MKFKSKIDWANYLILVMAIIILALPNFVFKFSWIYLAFMLVADLCFFNIILFSSYTLTEKDLVIRMGVIKFDISLDSITQIKKIKGWKNQSCATSLRCLEVRYGGSDTRKYNKINISPEREDEFLEMIEMKCQGLLIIDERGE